MLVPYKRSQESVRECILAPLGHDSIFNSIFAQLNENEIASSLSCKFLKKSINYLVGRVTGSKWTRAFAAQRFAGFLRNAS